MIRVSVRRPVQYTVSSQNTVESTGELFYDYENQAWVVNGKYQRCEHPDSMTCLCYGRVHAGEWYTIPETGDGAYVQA